LLACTTLFLRKFDKIEGALNGVLRYTIRHDGSSFLSSRPRLLQVALGQKHVNLTSSVYHNLSNFSSFQYP
jgi:hypothetical protein